MGGRTKGLDMVIVFIDIISDTVFYCNEFSWRKGLTLKNKFRKLARRG